MYDLGLIGHYTDLGVGYGNISERIGEGQQFVISGTQTGHLPQLGREHYTVVTDYDIDQNTLKCSGPIKASSESLTHAAIYELNTAYKTVIHIHHRALWQKMLYQVPTSHANVPYGTPEMAYEIKRLYHEESMNEQPIMAMAGHDEGIIAFGKTFEEAGQLLIDWLQKLT